MRISTSQFYETTNASYQRNYANYIKTAEQSSSGVKMVTASDDPVGAARVLQLSQQNAMLTQYASNISSINNNAANTETALKGIVDALQSAQELAVKAGNGAYTDADRKSTADELQELQKTILGLMNTQDANGQYLFAGSDGSAAPYSMNADGTYSYHGNQTAVNLAVGDGLVLANNTTGWDAFEKAVNTTRTSATLTTPATDDGKVGLSGGVVSSTSSYNASFIDGQPYSLSFVSDPAGPKYVITDKNGTDVTGDAASAGSFDFSNSANQTVKFRGVDFTLNINLSATEAASATTANDVLAGTGATPIRTYELTSTPSTISTSRSPGNASAATITSAAVGTTAAEQTAFNNSFPAGGGAVLQFTATGYELYATPVEAGKAPVATGTGFGPTISAAGVTFTLSGTPQDGDSFVVEANTHQSKNILNTLSDLITSLTTPTDGDQVALQKLNAALTSALGNLTSGVEQASTARSAIGARQVAAESQGVTNDMLQGNNTVESQSYTKVDQIEAATQLTLQKTMLDASQAVFLQVSKLNLFSQL
jgi:flagellar hook-associated protein 3 FlgL